ncbi:hypothetical protein BRADI_4g22166v3 [Brachypodium distachyon]|uniref:SWIM-type domain-containing protein n=1 Tax=Brachypodium distachyon TaxID=15368 RepID=A0A2K2CPE7_BRADI|nr:hypothetical protein BRADI_4g22166v3 [Brachypodium distachyon]
MFEQFGASLCDSRQYLLEEVKDGELFIARHSRATEKEKWCKVMFQVRVHKATDLFECECGFFEHSGFLCGHALKVGVTREGVTGG